MLRGNACLRRAICRAETNKVWGDSPVVTLVVGPTWGSNAVARPLLHDAHVIPLKGESYRLKDKRKAGLIERRSTANTAD